MFKKVHVNNVRDWVRGDEKGILPVLPNEVLADKWNRFKINLIDYIEANCFLEYQDPQANWTNGCPLGNGDMGAMMYGPPEATMFMIGKTDLWDYTPVESNFTNSDFPAFRKVLEEGDEVRFQQLRRGNGKKLQQLLPSGKPGAMLKIELFPSAVISKFKQRLSVANAEVVQTWQPVGDRRYNLRSGTDQKVCITSFIHAARNVLVVNITPGTDIPWHEPVYFSLFRYEDPDMSAPEINVEGNTAWFRQELPGNQYFIVMLGTDSEDFQIIESAGRILGKGIPHNKSLNLYVTIVTSLDTNEPLVRAKENIIDAKKSGFNKLVETHRKWWHNFWHRGFVCTPWKKVEEKWYYALYLQASICRPGCMSPGLQGNWIKEHYPAWSADFHNNIDMQIVYWGQYTANRLELGEPMYRLMWEVLPQCKKDTKEFFKMQGARYPISMGPDGCETAPFLLLHTWVGAGGWIAEHFWWHYKYSQDKEFLAKYAYPLLKEVALFYEDYLQEDKDGTLYAYPTIYLEIMATTRYGAGKNSAWDLPVIIRTFQIVKEAAKELGVDSEDCKRWEDILKRIAPISANKEGVWMEFADKRGLWHQGDYGRFMAIFPMELVGEDSGPEYLREQAQKTIEEYYQFRKEKAHEVGGFSGGIQATALARMGHSQRALEMAEFTCKCENISTSLNSSGFITYGASCLQIDVPPGLSIFLNEMLLQSYDGIIRVFPAAPSSDEDVRFHSLRAQGGFLVSAERRKNLTMYVIIKSLSGNPVRMRNPFVGENDPGVWVEIYKVDEDKEFTEQIQMEMQSTPSTIIDHVFLPGEIIEFPTEKGQVYIISKAISWLCNIPVVNVTNR